MQKKVYTKDLSLDEIMERLNKGEKIINDDCGYFVMYNGTLVQYDKNVLVAFNPAFYPDSDTFYFLDENPESEIDESCIGKLCYFWDDDESDEKKFVSVLVKINDDKYRTSNYKAADDNWYDFCRILTQEEALKLIKE